MSIKLLDGFVNILKSLGTEKDGRTHNRYVQGCRIDNQTANSLYIYNWLARQIVDAPVDDATRKWRDLLIPDADKKQKIEEAYEELDVKSKINIAMKWARVFGGAVILVIIENDDPEEPLVIENIKQGSLSNLIVLDRYHIINDEIDRDILSVNYGQPVFYTVARDGQKIHRSRVIKFTGKITTINEMEVNNFWGSSIYTDLYDPIADSQSVSNSINTLVYEANIDVYRIEGFNQLVSENKDDLVTGRLKIINKMKSIVNGIVIDKNDEYEKKVNTFTTLPDIDDRYIQKVAGASNIPVTRLLGTSPSGQNATGESDMRNYYDNVQKIQENEIRPRLDYLDRIIMKSEFGENETFNYRFNPLQQNTETEQAAIDLSRAQRDLIYIDADIITPVDVLAGLANEGTYPTVDAVRVDEEKEELENDPFAEETNGEEE